jgi:glycosyltransferase involved in cell wall biosynthesis
MISVCMAVKNGGRFLAPQLDSILPQLNANDEIIISDDHSQDNTKDVASSFNDLRIRFIKNPKKGLVQNFESSLTESRGEIIFLADQDDVWMPNKIKATLPLFNENDLVMSDCRIVDDNLATIHDSFYTLNSSRKGVVRNLYRNSYMGCCMAFKKSVLAKALPFPKDLIIHDQWLGLIAELNGNVAFIQDKLVLHRRHQKNASSTSTVSNLDLSQKIAARYATIKNLIYAR